MTREQIYDRVLAAYSDGPGHPNLNALADLFSDMIQAKPSANRKGRLRINSPYDPAGTPVIQTSTPPVGHLIEVTVGQGIAHWIDGGLVQWDTAPKAIPSLPPAPENMLLRENEDKPRAKYQGASR